MKIEQWDIDRIRPYEKNPRRNGLRRKRFLALSHIPHPAWGESRPGLACPSGVALFRANDRPARVRSRGTPAPAPAASALAPCFFPVSYSPSLRVHPAPIYRYASVLSQSMPARHPLPLKCCFCPGRILAGQVHGARGHVCLGRLGPMPARDDPYRVLGVPSDASVEETKTAYRKAALKHHPDISAEEPKEAARRFHEATEAYKVILRPVLSRGQFPSPAAT